MKNIFLRSLLTLLFLSTCSALAENTTKNFYFKIEGGVSAFDSIKEKALNVNLKSKAVATIDIGVGTYINNMFRLEVAAGHMFSPSFENKASFSPSSFYSTPVGNILLKETLPNLINDQFLIKNGIPLQLISLIKPTIIQIFTQYLTNPNSLTNLTPIINENIDKAVQGRNYTPIQVQAIKNAMSSFANNRNSDQVREQLNKIKIITNFKLQTTVQFSMIKAYADIVEFNDFKVFIGGGVGVSFLQEKISARMNVTIDNKNVLSINKTGTSKAAINLAYMISLGTSYKINDTTHTEIAYSYKDFGKTPSQKFEGIEVGENHYKSHSVTAGLRFNF